MRVPPGKPKGVSAARTAWRGIRSASRMALIAQDPPLRFVEPLSVERRSAGSKGYAESSTLIVLNWTARGAPCALGRVLDRRDVGVNPRDAEVPVAVTAGPAFRQRGIGKRLETKAGDRLERCLDLDDVRGERRVRARREQRTVVERRQRDAVRRARVHRRERRPGAVGRAHRLLPLLLCVAHGRRDCLQFLVEPIDVRLHLLARLLLIGRREIEPGFKKARAVAERAALEVGVGEEREQPEVVLLTERVVLVVVALRAGERGAEPDGGGRVRAIHEDLVHRLVRIDAALPRSSSRCDGSRWRSSAPSLRRAACRPRSVRS